MNKNISLGTLLAPCFTIVLIGCTNTQHQVLSSTGTVIGIDISQDPATQAPHAKIGYNRGEFAIVPTNRSQCTKKKDSEEWECTPQQGAGAKDTTDVLMELRFKSNLTFQGDAGIYQRLAIGSTAVQQKGAAFMFSKDDKGTVQADVAKYISQAKAEITIEEQETDKIVAYTTDGAGVISAGTLDQLIAQAQTTYPGIFSASVITKIKSAKTGGELKKILVDPLDATINPLYQSLPADKR